MRIIGTVPQPMSNLKRPPFDHDPSSDPRRTWRTDRPVGSKGRKISVTTHSEWVAGELVKVFEAVFCKVQVRAGR